jgi:hypothetical protein
MDSAISAAQDHAFGFDIAFVFISSLRDRGHPGPSPHQVRSRAAILLHRRDAGAVPPRGSQACGTMALSRATPVPFPCQHGGAGPAMRGRERRAPRFGAETSSSGALACAVLRGPYRKELVMKARQGWFVVLAIVVSAGSLGCGAPAASSGFLDRTRLGEHAAFRPSVDSPRSSSAAIERPRSSAVHASVAALPRARR